jgi:DNA-binding NarL/FixJ family response regulator
MKKVVIVEDHRVLRAGLKSLLNQSGAFKVVGEAGEGMEAIKCIQKNDPDLILLDLSLPKMDGISVLKEIRRQVKVPRILVLTMNDSEEKIVDGFNNGADGYCLKDAASGELIAAMETVLKGQRYISPGIAGKVVDGFLKQRGDQTVKQRPESAPRPAGDESIDPGNGENP